MKSALAVITLLFASNASISYFKYQRPVESVGAVQHYVIVDESIWKHARPDLADLRLYAGGTEVPYASTVQRGSSESDRKEVPVLQQSTIAGKMQFFIDMSDLVEYDHIDLKLATKNFVAHARVEGQDDLHGLDWAMLGDSILYDLSKERLGSNSMLRVPRAAYRYLRVTIDGPVKPEEIVGATSEIRQDEKPAWLEVNGQPKISHTAGRSIRWNKQRLESQSGNDTLLLFEGIENVPVERIVFDIDPAQPNFRREVEIQNDRGQVIGRGEINRIHMVRSGRKIDSEDHEVSFFEHGDKSVAVIIYNGDDSPLKLNGARLEQHERRIYFNPPSFNSRNQALTLYYGDEKLESPVYDYAKLFAQEKDATEVQLGPETTNAAFTGRPDERQWTEKHPAILWIAIIAAVLALGAMALRSMRSGAAA
jgi:hypothetical protein